MLTAIAALAFLPSALPQERIRSISGDVRMLTAFPSKILGNQRDVAVYLPPGYDRSRDRYPVLYMGDGQNVFDGMTSFIPNKEWRIDETCEELIRAGRIQPLIVVAVNNMGVDRANEYLPTRMGQGTRAQGGKAALFGQFLAEELKPAIDRKFRTRRGPNDTGLGGSSFGGIMALYVGLTRPETFGKLAVISPSVWWDSRVMLKFVELLPEKPRTRIWLDIGTEEGPGSEANAAALRDALVARGWVVGEDLQYFVDSGAIHQEGPWAKRMPMVLEFLFPARK